MGGGGVLAYLRGARGTARRSLGLTGIAAVLVASGWVAVASRPAAARTTLSATAVYAWGDNSHGQIGDGSTVDSATPVRLTLPGGVTPTAVSEGYRTSLALGSNGSVYAWGDNSDGQLGNGSTTDSPTPVRVLLPGGERAIAVSEGNQTSLALGRNGIVYAWGDNTDGQLGDGTTTGPGTCAGSPCSTKPVAVKLPRGAAAAAVSEGNRTSLALGRNGIVYAWGDNTDGQLGYGTTSNSSTPVRVKLPSDASAAAVSEGAATSLARTRNGRIYAWGDNADGQLGNGSTTNSSTPVRVMLPSGTSAVAVSEGSGTSLAILRGPTAAPVPTTTVLTASPNPAVAGAAVTLTATVTAADGTSPAGSVQFLADGTDIGSPVAVSSGSASTTTTFADPGTQALLAVFSPASATYAASSGELSLVVTTGQGGGGGGGGCDGNGDDDVAGGGGAGGTASSANAGTEPIAVTVPCSGTFTVSIAPGTLVLTASGPTATGMLEDVTVSDTRNDFPGWSASGQASGFTGSGTAVGTAISGNQLGWTPAVVGSLQGGATLGAAVAPAAPGLGGAAAELASAAAGNGAGTNVLTANLHLLIPDGQQPGPYGVSLTITYVESAL